MIPYSFYSINLMQIEIFLKCAEYNNFSRAAEDLQITTGMVSKKIASLESTTGIILFVREKNRVSLTPAGKELYKDLTRAMIMIDDSFEHASRIQRVIDDPIKFGICDATNVERYFIPLISAFETNDNAVSFRAVTSPSFAMIDDLILDHIDIFFAPKFLEEALSRQENLDYFMAVPSPLYAGISETNSLSRKEKLNMQDVKNLGFILPSEKTNSYYRKWIMDLCARNGYVPKTDDFSETGSGAYLNINDSNVFITDKYYHHFHTKAVVFKEIEDTESGLLMIWKKNPRPMVARLIEHAKSFYIDLK